MAQIENLNSENTWNWNCSSKNDLDYRVIWTNAPLKKLKITRHNLIGIKYSMKCWNKNDGWYEEHTEQMLPAPVESYTFTGVAMVQAFAIGIANNYFGVRYKIETELIIIYGEPNGEIQEHIITKTNGCFIKSDPYYYEKYPGCIPPDITCNES